MESNRESWNDQCSCGSKRCRFVFMHRVIGLMYWFTILGICLVFISYLWRTRKRKRIVRPEKASRPPPLVAPMPLADARSLVDEIARAGGLLTVAPACGMASIPPGLGPVTQEFFKHYQRVG